MELFGSKKKQYGGSKMANEICVFWYVGVFGVGDSEFSVKIHKFKVMSDEICNYVPIRFKLGIWVFSKSEIMFFFKIHKFKMAAPWLQDGGRDLSLCSDSIQNWFVEISRVENYDFFCQNS